MGAWFWCCCGVVTVAGGGGWAILGGSWFGCNCATADGDDTSGPGFGAVVALVCKFELGRNFVKLLSN